MKLFEERVDFKSIAERLTTSMLQSGLITDINEGGVAQLLAETFAREMATFYEILKKAHAAGYLDTAEGGALDSVVAVLGVNRAAPGLLRGQVEFSCDTLAPRDIVIPAGARVSGPPLPPEGDKVPPMETVEQVRIPAGKRSVRAAVQEVSSAERSERKRLPAGALSIMPRPLLGVDKVTNPDPIVQGEQKESDEHLRARAGAVLREAQKGTVEAIKAAVHSLGIKKVKVIEDSTNRPGWLEVQVSDPELEGDPVRRPSAKNAVNNAVNNVKAAGINVEMKYLKSVYCEVIATVVTGDDDMEADAFDKVAQSLKQDIKAFIDGLDLGTSIDRDKLQAVMLAHPMVKSVDKDKIKINMWILESKAGKKEEKNVTKERGEHPGIWYIGPLENATVEPDRYPVTIIRKQPPTARLDLAVTLYKTDQSLDDVHRNIRRAVENFVKVLRPEGIDEKILNHEELAAKLREEVPVVIDLGPATRIIHQEDGCVEDLKKQHPVTLRQDEQLIIGGIDTTTAVFCKVDVTVEPVENTDMAAEALEEMANDVKEFIKGLGPGVSITESELKAMLLSDPRVKDAIIEIKMYLPASSDSDEDVTDERRRAGIWHINPSECADISPNWPVVVKFKQTVEE